MAALTVAGVCNMALGYVGERQTIQSLSDPTAPALACVTFYEETVKACLAQHWWRFATKRETLALSTEERDEWGYVYALPSDCLQPQYLWNGARNATRDQLIPFTTELNDAGTNQLLMTDLVDAVLVYTKLLTNPAQWGPAFGKAVAWALAAELALVLPVKPEVAIRVGQQAPLWLERAAALDEAGKQDDPAADPDLIRAR